MFFHSSSYTANPIACAAANANLAIWREEPVLDRIADLGDRQQDRLDRLATHALIRNPRRLGTIVAAEIGASESAYLNSVGTRLKAFAHARGVLIRPLGNTVYVMPPYCIDDADLDAIYRTITDFLEQEPRMGDLFAF